MTQAAEKVSTTSQSKGRRRKLFSVNWIGAATAIAGLLSGSAAMITAANGVWHPPVAIPVIQARITWVGPTPAAAAQPAATQSLAATPQPTPTPSPSNYQADWTNGMGGWVGGEEWKTVAGTLISDGSAYGESTFLGQDSVQPPFRPTGPDYAVDARIKIISDPQRPSCEVALEARAAPDGQGQNTHGYYLGYSQGTGAVIRLFHPGASTTISHATYSPGTDWHEYYAAVKDNQLTLKIDGSTVLQAFDNNYLEPGRVGVVSEVCQVQVSGFSVTPL